VTFLEGICALHSGTAARRFANLDVESRTNGSGAHEDELFYASEIHSCGPKDAIRHAGTVAPSTTSGRVIATARSSVSEINLKRFSRLV